MNDKKILRISSGAVPHQVGNGFTVSNYIPGNYHTIEETSPFFLLDHNAPMQVGPSKKKLGVGEHPHRGFETVTIVKEGSIAHRDSSGGGGVINAGDVQWMTAGSGIMHEEFLSESFQKNGGMQHFLQLWVNLPAKDKMTAPKYQNITAQDIPVLKLDDKGSVSRVIAGNLNGTAGPASTFTSLDVYDIDLTNGAEVSVSFPSTRNTMILVVNGKAKINDSQAVTGDFVLFAKEGEDIRIAAGQETNLIVFSGEPINEPVAAYGPFVMNTKEEIMQALDDYRSGKFGHLN